MHRNFARLLIWVKTRKPYPQNICCFRPRAKPEELCARGIAARSGLSAAQVPRTSPEYQGAVPTIEEEAHGLEYR